MADAWLQCSSKSDMLPGANVYAAKMAGMYSEMALRCAKLFHDALESEPLGWKATSVNN